MRASRFSGKEGLEGPVAPLLQPNEDKTAALESEQSLPSVNTQRYTH